MRSLPAFALLFGAFVELAAAQDRPWAGKIVLIKRHDARIVHTDALGKIIEAAELDGVPYRVLDQDGERIKVRTRHGVTGWFDKAEAVLLDEAVKYFTSVLDTSKDDANAYNSRAIAWQLRGQPEKALADFGAAIRLAPKAHAFYNNRAITWEEMKDYPKAIADFTEAIRLAPNFGLYYSNRRSCHVKAKDYAAALKDDNDAIRLDPKDPRHFYNRGIDLRFLKEYARAIDDFNEVLRLTPNHVGTLYQRGLTFSVKREYAKAIDDFTQVHVLAPMNADNCNELAWLLATAPDGKDRDGKRALELAKRALKLNKLGERFYADTLAAAHAEVGDFDEAVRWQELAIKGHPMVNAEAQRRLELFREKQPYRLK